MKKIIYFLRKKKRVVEISNNVSTDAVPDPPRNIPHYIPKPIEHYNFKINGCVNDISESNCISNNVQTKVSEETTRFSGYSESPNEEVTESNEVEELERSLENDLTPKAQQLPVVCLPPNSATISDSVSDRLNTKNDLNIKSADNVDGSPFSSKAVEELNEAVQKLSNDLSRQRVNSDKRNNGNTYVITISNSAHFHIGSQKTINYPNEDNKSNEKGQLPLSDSGNREFLPLNDSQILGMKDALSENDLLQISLSVREKWKDFAKNLGVNESTIRELEDLSDNDYNLIVYDILRQYLDRYPNTSVGYMIDVLTISNETEAVKKLLENR